MKKRYSIMVCQNGESETELCQIDNNPECIARAAAAKTIGRARIAVYTNVRVVDNQETAPAQ